MDRLTARQEQVLAVVKRHIDEHGLPPTRADIAKELGFRSANAAEEHLRALARKGVIEMVPGASRGIRLPEASGLPIVGRVAAGEPILAIEHIEEHCAVDPSLFHPPADYLLCVNGDSMIKVGIHDGDLLAVHSTPVAENGAIVVARLDDEVTVKRLRKGRSKQLLQLLPENDDLEPINVDLSQSSFSIEGLSVGVIRRSIG
ncbi:MAG: transcriptional repressor LexA [Pseudomonadota bacterium]